MLKNLFPKWTHCHWTLFLPHCFNFLTFHTEISAKVKLQKAIIPMQHFKTNYQQANLMLNNRSLPLTAELEEKKSLLTYRTICQFWLQCLSPTWNEESNTHPSLTLFRIHQIKNVKWEKRKRKKEEEQIRPTQGYLNNSSHAPWQPGMQAAKVHTQCPQRRTIFSPTGPLKLFVNLWY